jgi:hypothetical protein
MCGLNIRITSLWKFLQGDYYISATFKISSQHGLACHFGDIADLNLESVASKGPSSVYAETYFTSYFGTVRTCLVPAPFTRILRKANNLQPNLGTLTQ